jgi:hypothetical protein
MRPAISAALWHISAKHFFAVDAPPAFFSSDSRDFCGSVTCRRCLILAHRQIVAAAAVFMEVDLNRLGRLGFNTGRFFRSKAAAHSKMEVQVVKEDSINNLL